MKPVMIINKYYSLFCSKIKMGIFIALLMFSWNSALYAESRSWKIMSNSEENDNDENAVRVMFFGAILLVVGTVLYSLSTKNNPNQAEVEINSEPQGGRLYDEKEGYIGVTPLKMSYTISEDAYQEGIIRCSPLICFVDKYLPQKVQMELKIDYKIPKNKNRKINYHQLFVLQRDPNAPQVSEQKIDITTRQEESNLDKALKAMNLMLMIQSLQPIK